MATVDQPAAEAALPLDVLVEVHPGGVLVEARGELVLGLLDRHAVDVVDALAHPVVAQAVRAAGEPQVVVGEGELLRHLQGRRRQRRRQLRHHRIRRRARLVALAHQDPAAVAQHLLAHLVGAEGAHVDDAAVAGRGLLQADHLALGLEAVARVDRHAEEALGVAQVGHGVQRDVGDGLAEDQVEDQEVVQGSRRQAQALGEAVGALQREAAAVERLVERHVALAGGARRRMAQPLADGEVLEEVAAAGLGGRSAARHRLRPPGRRWRRPARRCAWRSPRAGSRSACRPAAPRPCPRRWPRRRPR